MYSGLAYIVTLNICGLIAITHTCRIIVHFKRLGSRHFLKEMKIQSILLKYNMIFRQT